MATIKDCPFFCSWSGGKDSCLALYHAIQEGGSPRFLLTTLEEEGERSRGHGLPVELVQKQASLLDISLVVRSTSWEGYEKNYLSVLREFSRDGIEVGVFGDIDLEEHREWVERVCSYVNMRPYLPLWKRERSDLLKELIETGFKATIVTVKDGVLDRRFLGKTLDSSLLQEIKNTGIDPSGEGGEYHTVVTDGPIFTASLNLGVNGQVHRDGHWALKVSLI